MGLTVKTDRLVVYDISDEGETSDESNSYVVETYSDAGQDIDHRICFTITVRDDGIITPVGSTKNCFVMIIDLLDATGQDVYVRFYVRKTTGGQLQGICDSRIMIDSSYTTDTGTAFSLVSGNTYFVEYHYRVYSTGAYGQVSNELKVYDDQDKTTYIGGVTSTLCSLTATSGANNSRVGVTFYNYFSQMVTGDRFVLLIGSFTYNQYTMGSASRLYNALNLETGFLPMHSDVYNSFDMLSKENTAKLYRDDMAELWKLNYAKTGACGTIPTSGTGTPATTSVLTSYLATSKSNINAAIDTVVLSSAPTPNIALPVPFDGIGDVFKEMFEKLIDIQDSQFDTTKNLYKMLTDHLYLTAESFVNAILQYATDNPGTIYDWGMNFMAQLAGVKNGYSADANRSAGIGLIGDMVRYEVENNYDDSIPPNLGSMVEAILTNSINTSEHNPLDSLMEKLLMYGNDAFWSYMKALI